MSSTRYILMLTISCSLLFPRLVIAEGGCPPGYYPHNVPGLRGCAPIPGYVTQSWIDAYGTLVWFDSKDGDPGYSYSAKHTNKNDAETAAINKCERLGGVNCNVVTTIRNGFIVVGANSAGGFSAATGDTEQNAIENLRTNCNRDNFDCSVTKVIDTRGWHENVGR